eukprot:TRINITY_DN4532_c0_g1_i14.p1 TRINITY_DN4532_c0_g1~~TRINITY_DN4532_c0_g1_i14.p1  ORF type:complete len:1002 (+),score=125.74 TRINITY_DN4532_c0_g1_i14:191-3007(+)
MGLSWESITCSSDCMTMAAMAYFGNIWVSRDAGVTWVEDASVNETKYWRSITSSSDGVIMAAVPRMGNIWTSEDSGVTWVEDMSIGSTQYWSSIKSSSDGKMLAALAHSSLWISKDSGVSWVENNGTKDLYLNAIAVSDDFTTMAAVSYDRIWISRDSGFTWVVDQSVVEGYTHFESITCSYDCKAMAVVGSGIWLSKDSGATWATEYRDFNYMFNPRTVKYSSDGTKLVLVDHGNGNLWVGSADSHSNEHDVYSHGGGEVSWAEDTSVGIHRGWWSITSSSDGTQMAAVTQGHQSSFDYVAGGMWLSNDSGVTWDQLHDSDWVCITSSSDGMVMAALPAYSSGVWMSRDSGITWVEEDWSAYVGSWKSITSSSNGTMLAALSDYGLWTSRDSGFTWVAQDSVWDATYQSGFYSGACITCSSDGTTMAIAPNEGTILLSYDSGATWVEDMSVGSPQCWMSITSSSDGVTMAAVVYHGNIWVSRDAGTTWVEDTSVGIPQKWMSITCSSDCTMMAAVVDFGFVWTSRDSGATWFEDKRSSQQWWFSVTSSADGRLLAAVPRNGNIWTRAEAEMTTTKSVTTMTISVTTTTDSTTMIITTSGASDGNTANDHDNSSGDGFGSGQVPTALFERRVAPCNFPVTDEESCEDAANSLGLPLVGGSLGSCRVYDGKASFAQWGACTFDHMCICSSAGAAYAIQIDSGTCEDHGYQAVTSLAECRQSATALGYGKVHGMSSGACRIYLDMVSFASWGPCTHEHQCICLPDPIVTTDSWIMLDGIWQNYQVIASGTCRSPVRSPSMCDEVARNHGYTFMPNSLRAEEGECRAHMLASTMSEESRDETGDCSESHACVCLKPKEEALGFKLITAGTCDDGYNQGKVSDLSECQYASKALGFTMPFLNEELGPDKACRVYIPTQGASLPSFSAWGACSRSHACICHST